MRTSYSVSVLRGVMTGIGAHLGAERRSALLEKRLVLAPPQGQAGQLRVAEEMRGVLV